MERTLKALLCVLALTCAGALGACGGDDDEAPLGSAENPQVAKQTGENDSSPGSPHNESGTPGTDTAPSYQKLLQRQQDQSEAGKPESRFTPCNLVTPGEAEEILGTELRAPVEAPQGPTCIYRSRDGKRFVTVAVETVDFAQIKRRLRGARSLQVASRTAYCGKYGQPMLYAPLSDGRVLSIAGSCPVASKFAAEALPRLPA